MRFSTAFFFLLLFALPVCGQQQSTSETNEAKALESVTQSYIKMRQSSSSSGSQDLKARSEAATALVNAAKEFLRKFPASKSSEDAHGLISIGLSEAALAGDTNAAEELQRSTSEALKDPNTPETLKLHTFLVNYLTQWGKKNGRHDMGEASPEFQQASVDGMFAAADVLSDKESIFKMVLLQAKSGRELTSDAKKAIAERVLQNPHAPDSIKAEARRILTGEQPYAIGKPLEIAFTALDGTRVDLKNMKGKVVLVDFWATWCGPCVGEVPAVKSVYDTYHAKGFEIIGISLDEDKDALQNFTKEHGMPWPQYFDGKHWNNDISFRFGIGSVPTEWLIDKKGNLREIQVRGRLDQMVEALLKED